MQKVIYKNHAVGAKDNMAYSVNTKYLNAQNLLSKQGVYNYATFENNGFDLHDEYLQFFDPFENEHGFMFEELSDSNGNLSHTHLICAVSNGEAYTSPGITLHFRNEPARLVRVTYYSNVSMAQETEIATQDYICTELESFLPLQVEDWKAIRIDFESTYEPYHFVRLWDIDFGENITFTKFFSHTIVEQMNFHLDDLPINTLEFEVLADEEFAPIYGQEIETYFKDELMGRFYVTESEVNTFERHYVKASDIMQIADDTTFFGDVYSAAGDPVIETDILPKVSQRIQGNPKIAYDSLAEETNVLRGHLPITNCRYAICQYAWAMNMWADTTRGGGYYYHFDGVTLQTHKADVLLKELNTTVKSVIPPERILGTAKYTEENLITDVIYNDLFHLKSDTRNLIWAGAIEYGDPPVRIDLTTPYYSIAPPEAWMELEPDTGRNVIIITYAPHDSGPQLEIYPCISRAETYELKNPVASADTRTELKDFRHFTLSNTKISREDRNEQLLSRCTSKGIIKAKIVLDGERLGDYVEIETKYSGVKRGIITQMIITGVTQQIAEVVIQEWQPEE